MSSHTSAHPPTSSEETKWFDDPIVAEVRQARKEILDSYGGDFEAMMRDVMKRQYESGREIVKAKPRSVPTSRNPE